METRVKVPRWHGDKIKLMILRFMLTWMGDECCNFPFSRDHPEWQSPNDGRHMVTKTLWPFQSCLFALIYGKSKQRRINAVVLECPFYDDEHTQIILALI